MATDQAALLVSLAECKAYLRIGHDEEDALLAGLVRAATGLCEAFVGEWLVVRAGEQRLERRRGLQRLRAEPVRAVTAVRDGETLLGSGDFGWSIDADGVGRVELLDPGAWAAPVVHFMAGQALDWNGVPEAVRQGVVRMVAHLHAHRDAADGGPPPAAVVALWRPYRRVRLG
jgi:uncharacterized phiE125 gp8 family phage protein